MLNYYEIGTTGFSCAQNHQSNTEWVLSRSRSSQFVHFISTSVVTKYCAIHVSKRNINLQPNSIAQWRNGLWETKSTWRKQVKNTVCSDRIWLLKNKTQSNQSQIAPEIVPYLIDQLHEESERIQNRYCIFHVINASKKANSVQTFQMTCFHKQSSSCLVPTTQRYGSYWTIMSDGH